MLYTAVAANKWVIRGRFHEADERFPEEHRGKQATPASIAAIAMAHVVEPSAWTQDDIDEVGFCFYKCPNFCDSQK